MSSSTNMNRVSLKVLQFKISNWNHLSSRRWNRCHEPWYQMLQPRWREWGLRPHLCQSLFWHHWLSRSEQVQCCGVIYTILCSWRDLVEQTAKAHFKKVGIGFIIIGFKHGIYREGGEELWGHAAWVQNTPWAAILWTLPVSRAASWRGRGLKAACLLEDHNMEMVGSPSFCVHCPWHLSPLVCG